MRKENRESGRRVRSSGYPESLREAVLRLVLELEAEDLGQLSEIDENAKVSLHFGLGMWIRNNFGLWSEESALMKELQCLHADDASSRIIDALLSHLGREPDTVKLKAEAMAELEAKAETGRRASATRRKHA